MQNKYIKSLSLIITIIMLLSFCSCSESDNSSKSTSSITESINSNEVSTDSITLKIANSNAVEDNFIGFSGIYMCYNYIEDTAEKYTDEMMQIEMDRLADMKVSVVRTQYRFDYAFDYDTNSWNWESENMKGFYTFMDEMEKRGISVAMQIGYFDNEVLAEKAKNPFYVLAGGNTEKMYSLYSEWVVESVKQIRAHGADNLNYLVAFTEPCQPWLEAERTVEKASEKLAIWKKSLLSADTALRKAGLRDTLKIIGPNVVSNLFLLEYAVKDQEVSAAIDIFSFHVYVPGSTMYADTYYQWYEDYMVPMKELVESTGKEVWMDEWNFALQNDTENIKNSHPWLGTQNAIAMVAGMNAGLQTMIRWTLADQKWPNESQTNTTDWLNGVQLHGITPNLLTSSIPHPVYYAYSMISKYTSGKNVKLYKGTGKGQIYLTACQLDDGNWTVIVVSTNIIPQDISITFEKELGVNLYRHVYNPSTIKPTAAARIIDPDKTFENVTDTFRDNIVSGGVYVYTSVKE